MIGTFASRAFLTRVAIFGTDVTHDGRTSQIVFVMSSTRSAAPCTGTSTATGSGIFGIGEDAVGGGVAVATAVDAAGGFVDPAVVGDGEPPVDAAGAQAANVTLRTIDASLFIGFLPHE